MLLQSKLPHRRLNLSHSPFITKTLGILSSCIDEYSSEQSKFQYMQRQIARQKTLLQALQGKRVPDFDLPR